MRLGEKTMTIDTETANDAGRSEVPGRWPLLAVLTLVVSFLLLAHGAHAVAWLPLLLAFACPLLHLLQGHAGHGAHSSAQPSIRPFRLTEAGLADRVSRIFDREAR